MTPTLAVIIFSYYFSLVLISYGKISYHFFVVTFPAIFLRFAVNCPSARLKAKVFNFYQRFSAQFLMKFLLPKRILLLAVRIICINFFHFVLFFLYFCYARHWQRQPFLICECPLRKLLQQVLIKVIYELVLIAAAAAAAVYFKLANHFNCFAISLLCDATPTRQCLPLLLCGDNNYTSRCHAIKTLFVQNHAAELKRK